MDQIIPRLTELIRQRKLKMNKLIIASFFVSFSAIAGSGQPIYEGKVVSFDEKKVVIRVRGNNQTFPRSNLIHPLEPLKMGDAVTVSEK